MAPYCVFYFAVKGCNIWLPAGLRSLTTPWMLASMAGGGAKGSAKGGGGALAAMADSRSSTKVRVWREKQAVGIRTGLRSSRVLTDKRTCFCHDGDEAMRLPLFAAVALVGCSAP